MRGTSKKVAATCAALLGLGLVACGDNNGTADSGPPDSGRRDSGIDSGMEPEDAGPPDAPEPVDAPPDAGPPPANLRLAHLIPGAPDVHICLQIPAGVGEWLLITRDASNNPFPIPYGGVSNYVDRLPLPSPVTLGVRVFPEDAITGPTMDTCPTTATAAIIDTTIMGTSFTSGGFFTVAATGLPSGGTGEQVPELLVIEDDIMAPATAGNTRIRVLNMVPNMPPTAGTGIDVCFDPDGPTMPMTPVELFDDLSFEETAAYVERAAIPAGALTIHAHIVGVPDCVQMPPPTGTMLAVIPVPIPLPPTAPENYTATFDADTSNTIFFVGNGMIVNPIMCTMDSDCAAAGPAGTTCSPATGRCTHPLAPTILPVDDTFVPAP